MAKLKILWTNADPITAHTMVFMYAVNAINHNWWDDIEVMIWGSTAKLVVEDVSIQERINLAKRAGVSVVACIACARELGIVSELSALGIELRGLGQPLTDILKNDEKLLTI